MHNYGLTYSPQLPIVMMSVSLIDIFAVIDTAEVESPEVDASNSAFKARLINHNPLK